MHLLVPNCYSRVCCCQNTNLLSSQRGFLNIRMYHSKKKILIKLTNNDETKKRARASQKIRAKEKLKLSYGGPGQRQASDLSYKTV